MEGYRDKIHGTCNCCGGDVIEVKDYPTGERQFLPVVYIRCEDCGKEYDWGRWDVNQEEEESFC